MSERGPVGGAGELTALVEKWRQYCSRGPLREEGTNKPVDVREGVLRCADELQAVVRTHAAKAPQGVLLPINAAMIECLLHESKYIYKADSPAAYAWIAEQLNRNVCHAAREAYQELLALDRPSSEGGGLAANSGYQAPESTGGPQKMAALPYTREKIAIALWRLRSSEALRNWDTEHPWIKDYSYRQADAVLAVLEEPSPKYDKDGDELCDDCGVGLILGSNSWLHKDTGHARCREAAPSAPSLPVPGPVSDTTIHHGMFPPAPSGAAPSLSPNRKFVYRFLELPHHKKMAIGQELKLIEEGDPEKDAEMFEKWFARARERGQLSRMQELVMGEAAAPKPAPAVNCPTCTSPAPHLHPAVQHEGEVQPCSDTFHKQATSQNKLMGATPAPGAERLRERIAKAIWGAENAEEVRRNPRYPNTGEYAQWPEDAVRQPYCQSTYRIADAVLREALAAAPPAPTKLQQQAIDARRTGVAPDCFSGGKEHHAPTDIESLAATFHGIYQQEAKRQGDVRHKDAYAELPDNVKEFDRVLARYVLANFGDRHASAERVRQDAFAEAACAIERVAQGWADRIAQGLYQGETLRYADVRRDEGVDIAKLIRTLGALPPSTGEKS